MTFEYRTQYWTATYTGRGEFYSGIQTGDKVDVIIRNAGSRYPSYSVRHLGGGASLSLSDPVDTHKWWPLADMTFVQEVVEMREVQP